MRPLDSSLALPYLDSEMLWQYCRQAVNKEFEHLRYNCLFYAPHAKSILTIADDKTMSIYLTESGRVLTIEPTSSAIASALLGYFGEKGLRISIWAKLPGHKLTELLRDLQGCGFQIVCCHESHAIVQYPGSSQARHSLRDTAIR